MANPKPEEVMLTPAGQRELRSAIEALPDHHPTHRRIRQNLGKFLRMKRGEAMEFLRRGLSPYVLINDAVSPYEEFYDVIIDIIEAFGLSVIDEPTMEQEERCISALYVGAPLLAWKETATERLHPIRTGTATGAAVIMKAPNTVPTRTIPDLDQGDRHERATVTASKKASATSHAFKDKSRRYSVQLGCELSLGQFQREYKQVMEEHGILEEQKVQLMHHALDNPARD